MNKIICSQRTFERFMDDFDNMQLKANEYVPSLEELNIIKKSLPKYIPFLLWIDTTGEENEENKETRREVRKIIKEHLYILEGEEQ